MASRPAVAVDAGQFFPETEMLPSGGRQPFSPLQLILYEKGEPVLIALLTEPHERLHRPRTRHRCVE